MRIVVLDGHTLNPGDCPWDAVAALGDLSAHDRTPPVEIVERAKGAEIVLTNKAPLPAATLDALAPELKFVSVLATGVNVVDTVHARSLGVTVSNVPAYSTDSVAQLVFALLLELCHRAQRHSDGILERRRWIESIDFSYTETPQIELVGKTIGVVGFGQIGMRVGAIARAFGMRVLAHSPSRRSKPEYDFEWRDLDALFAESDVVSLNCPLTADNAGMVDAARLATMKPEALLINTARGGLVVEPDLVDALKRGVIAGAALDVIAAEPMAADSPLPGAPNLIVTPHIAWATLAARQRLMQITADNIAAFIAGNPIHVVN